MKTVFHCVVVLALCLSSCGDQGGPRGHKSPPAVRIDGGTTEARAARLTLTKDSVARLAIATAPVERRAMPSWRLIAAEVLLPPDARTETSAPWAARVRAVEGAAFPRALDPVELTTPLMRLEPLLTPERQVSTPTERLDEEFKSLDLGARRLEAERVRRAAEIRLDAASLEVARSEQLSADDVGSARRLENARTTQQLAASDLKSAVSQVELLAMRSESSPELDRKPGSTTIAAPRPGRIENVFVQEGQLVPAGARLFSVLDLREVWLRVPAYAGELAELNRSAAAQVSELADLRGEHSRPALPIQVTLSATPANATVDLYYALKRGDRDYQPGERLLVRLPRHVPAENLCVPWSSIVFDHNGHAWVYLRLTDEIFQRVSVLPSRREGDLAVLERGPEVGKMVVVVGAAELFGAEFGTGK
ncbi:MAG: efflux RND transporter periplasmic adaptor subunit [Planctomycetes bacterium]|nr:efflux RND transporter periplasmic adaptor subunit [Planctomycetota bacterium]